VAGTCDKPAAARQRIGGVSVLRKKALLLGFVTGFGGFARACAPLSLDTTSCAVTCTEKCPSGFECRGGFCVRDGFDGVCSAPEGSPADAGTRVLADAGGGDAGGGDADVGDAGAGVADVAKLFAYVDQGPDGATLVLVDPLAPAPRASTRLAPTEGIVDFAFSPDGRLLAIRGSDAGGTNRLSVFVAPSWEAIPIELPGSVLRYAWSSADGGVLAVAYRDGERAFLSGVRLSSERGRADAGSARVSATPLPAVPAFVDSELIWFSRTGLAFHGVPDATLPENHVLYFSELASDGFGVPVPDPTRSFTVNEQSALRIEPVDGGVWAVAIDSGGPPLIQAYAFSASVVTRVNHRPEVVLAPTGRLAARSTEAGVLEVYAALEQRTEPETQYYALPLVSDDGCGRLLAWSSQGDRLACVRDAGAGQGLQIYALDEATPSLVPVAVDGAYAYDREAAAFRRRVFSPSGRWFVFTTDQNLYFAELTGARLTVERAGEGLLAPLNRFAELSFSPDERWLLRHQGTNVWLHDPSGLEPTRSLSASSDDTVPCLESESAARSGWCGALPPGNTFAWSPDSRFAAYRLGTNQLLLMPSSSVERERPIRCSGSCGAYGFQP
jgi:hypothetical protein